MLRVLIVGDKDSQRIKPLLKTFLNDNRFDVNIWAPVYLKSFDDPQLIHSGFDVSKSTSYVGRNLSLNEIGCTLAHNRVREYLAVNNIDGVILEDDARIPDLDYFFHAATLFLDSTKIPAVLNFASRKMFEDFDNILAGIPLLQKQTCHLPGNVGYVLNKAGAKMLSTTDHRLYMMCDWPFSKIEKYTLTIPAVAHGDKETVSTIDPKNLLRRDLFSWKRAWSNRIKFFSFYWYIRHRNDFESLREYVIVMLIPRILFQVRRLSIRFGKDTRVSRTSS
jgi:GR25 family glycosyltransferase involved in LPS biosynthesis